MIILCIVWMSSSSAWPDSLVEITILISLYCNAMLEVIIALSIENTSDSTSHKISLFTKAKHKLNYDELRRVIKRE